MRIIAVLSLTFILTCCGNDVDDSEIVFSDTVLVWDINPDSMTMKKYMEVPDSVITVDRVVNGLNGKYPEVRLVFVKQGHDTLYTLIPSAEYLGDQMGSAGSAAWFADAAINLTSVPGVNYVAFALDTFSHAGSTIIGRDQYKNWKKE